MSWPLTKLRDVVIAHYGKALKKENRDESGSAEVFGSSGKVGHHSEHLVSNSTLIVGRKGSVGKVIYAQNGGWIIDTAYYLEVKEPSHLDLRYLYYALIKANLAQRTITTSIPGLNRDDFYDTKIEVPPLKEQKRIAEILDKADSVRQKRQQAMDLTEEFLRSVFLDMFGDPISNPKKWDVKKLSEISTKIHSGSTPKGGSKVYVAKGIKFLRSQNVWKNNILLDDIVYIDEKTHENMAKSSLKNKDILMTKTGRINTENSSLGRAALFIGEDDSANVNGHVYLIRLMEEAIHEFVVFILTTKEYRDYIRSVCVGGIDKRQINKDHLQDFPIISPPLDMQMQFADKVNVARKMLEKAKVGVKESEQMFNALSQKAFAGEL